MLTARRSLAGLGIAVSLLAGGLFAVAQTDSTNLPPPIISMSSVTLPSLDSVGILTSYTMRCDTAAKLCPNKWRVASIAKQLLGDTARTSMRLGLRDTFRLEKPLCPTAWTVRSGVIADHVDSALTVSSKSASTSMRIPCRNMTKVEVAELDSFPDGNRKIVLGTNWMYKATNRLDSVYTVQDKANEIQVPLGYTMGPLCHFRKNRYTGRVEVSGPDPLLKCEAARKAFQSAVSG